MRWVWAFVLVGLSFHFVPIAEARTCTAEGPFGPVEYDCCAAADDEEACRAKEAQADGFWTGPVAQTIYAVGGLGVTGAGGFFAWNRVRRQRRSLRELLLEVETTFASCKTNPQAGIERLAGLRTELNVRHENGHIGDNQFFELDRKIADFVTSLRVAELETAFPKLPLELMREVRSLLQDGHLSTADVQRVQTRAAAMKVPAATRKALGEHLEKWSQSDANRRPARRVAVLAPS